MARYDLQFRVLYMHVPNDTCAACASYKAYSDIIILNLTYYIKLSLVIVVIYVARNSEHITDDPRRVLLMAEAIGGGG